MKVVAQPYKGKRSPVFVDRGLTRTSTAGECRAGCYSKFILREGKPHMQICSRGKPSGEFPVRDAVQAAKRVAKACECLKGAKSAGDRKACVASGGAMEGYSRSRRRRRRHHGRD